METNIFNHTMRDMTKILAKFSTIIIKSLFFKQKYFYNYKFIKNSKSHSISESKLAKEWGGSQQRERDKNRESTLEERLLAHLATLHRIPVSPERGSWWPPPRSHVSAHIIKRTV